MNCTDLEVITLATLMAVAANTCPTIHCDYISPSCAAHFGWPATVIVTDYDLGVGIEGHVLAAGHWIGAGALNTIFATVLVGGTFAARRAIFQRAGEQFLRSGIVICAYCGANAFGIVAELQSSEYYRQDWHLRFIWSVMSALLLLWLFAGIVGRRSAASLRQIGLAEVILLVFVIALSLAANYWAQRVTAANNYADRCAFNLPATLAGGLAAFSIVDAWIAFSRAKTFHTRVYCIVVASVGIGLTALLARISAESIEWRISHQVRFVDSLVFPFLILAAIVVTSRDSLSNAASVLAPARRRLAVSLIGLAVLGMCISGFLLGAPDSILAVTVVVAMQHLRLASDVRDERLLCG